MTHSDIKWNKLDDFIEQSKDKVNDFKRLEEIENEKNIKNLYTYGIKNNAEQRDYLLNRLQELKGSNSNENL